ncbi:MAG: 1,2-phenylacetyl-CoA epoxidase subunit PaaC [Actinomycetota bacterium]
MSDALVSLLIALGDDELVLGHRHSEWTGFAPYLEEDVAFSSIAQDEIGHAAAFYGVAARLTGRTPDDIAFGREPGEYRNAILCERPNGDWAYTLARHWLYDSADGVRLEALETTTSDELGAVARKIRREERYHVIHADIWIRRIAHGPVEGRTKIIDALSRAFGEAQGLFEPIEREPEAVTEGWFPTPSDELLERFVSSCGEALDGLGLPMDIRASLDESAEFVASSSGDLIAGGGDEQDHPKSPSALGGRSGHHSEDFHALWDDMTSTYRASPGATW